MSDSGPTLQADEFHSAWVATKILVESFLKNKEFYVDSGRYQEAEVRTDFIDKLFIVLGWDVSHDRQRDPYRQEVKIEKSDSGRPRGKAQGAPRRRITDGS
jgi:adenine-specific DNA-methyltransferase